MLVQLRNHNRSLLSTTVFPLALLHLNLASQPSQHYHIELKLCYVLERRNIVRFIYTCMELQNNLGIASSKTTHFLHLFYGTAMQLVEKLHNIYQNEYNTLQNNKPAGYTIYIQQHALLKLYLSQQKTFQTLSYTEKRKARQNF